MSLLLPESGLIFWMFITFLVVFFILAKFGFPVITNMVNKRKEYIDRSLENADKANAKLADIQKASDEIVSKADKEQSRILREAAEEREKIISDAKKKAEIAAQKEIANAKETIKLQQEEATRSLRRDVSELAIEIAEKILRKKLDSEGEQMSMVDRMVDEAVNNKLN
ncbi:MAG: F0F1 ATP synthase subunit B [Bacteroidales bacterium]|jgi:F-type H+-transporting ATPase subunit b|nr:F0F1 ATP synthase subunit B [Bacteroidales bacterium]MCI2122238.1 F0F1 ATP synthase subunit B [Bacteroidales bacterium]MCI2144798.1 F0F1 ATP synthase subunit B [Bacteroidales bacterium]